MQNSIPSIYCYVGEYNLSDLSKLGKNINIIYRNYQNIDHLNTLLKLKLFCKKNGNKLYLSNNIKLSIKLSLDGIYIPSFNNRLNYCGIYNLPKNFKIIGSAHNLKELRIKEKQGVQLIILSPLFKKKKSNRPLGLYRYNILSKLTKLPTIGLGGITKKNIKTLKLIKSNGFASISFLKNRNKNGSKT